MVHNWDLSIKKLCILATQELGEVKVEGPSKLLHFLLFLFLIFSLLWFPDDKLVLDDLILSRVNLVTNGAKLSCLRCQPLQSAFIQRRAEAARWDIFLMYSDLLENLAFWQFMI